MFNTGSRPTITKSVVELANSGIESADSTADSAATPLKIMGMGFKPTVIKA